MINLTLAIKTLSPLHCGIGTGLKDIDLPVARHKVSGHPVIPGSSIKGVLKDEYLKGQTAKEIDDRSVVQAIFGAEDSGNMSASAMSIEDGILIALPARSYFGTFAYLTSPYTLQQFKKALVRSGVKKGLPSLPAVSGIDPAKNSYRALLTKDSLLVRNGNVLLEEMDLSVEDEGNADEWAACIAEYFCESEDDKKVLIKRFAIVDDNVLNFLCDTALPVDARIRIEEETGTVANGALWYEESVPPESLFMAVAGMDKSYKDKDKKTYSDDYLCNILTGDEQVKDLYVQMGGKATTGKGFVAVRIGRGGLNA
ncbi:type III-B CRISPR module RAMP protein Cmr4 [Maridesulfovibrio bastinii]|uniref:type III-B CRISPR module RAMP protein Cmr4 n=1 Tax=Maridesulfovibrio bastinii TaxID=47157 RepID=UPI0003FC91C5|nr:type III-B CRISPR module RAMP protein Cmr4 [Maridesulfovibrio bastinii]